MTKRVLLITRGALSNDIEFDHMDIDVPEDASVDDAARLVGLPRYHYLFVLNGVAVRSGTSLTNGDRLEIHRQTAGG